MSLTITSNFMSEKEIADQLAATGYKAAEEIVPVETPDPAEASAQPDAAGGTESPKPSDGESATSSEAVEKKTQEPKAAAEPTTEKPAPPRGNFKSKIEKQRSVIDRLQEDIELERGSRARIEAQLAEAKAKLDELTKSKEPAVADQGPVRPKRPTRAQFEYDDDKFDAAMDVYESEMDKYNLTAAQRIADERVATMQRQQAEAAAKAAQDKAFNDFIERKNAGAAQIEDWDETFEELGDTQIDFPKDGVMESAVLDSQNPAILLHFFAKDVVGNEAAELKRISALTPVAQVKALARLEDRLVAEHAAKNAPQAPAVDAKPAAGATPDPVPVKPKKATPSVDPIETLGSRTGGGGRVSLADLAERASSGQDSAARKEYWERRSKGEQR